MEGALVLCDIDGTLVDTKGAGLSALKRAAVDVFGGEGPPLDLRGATDGGIVRDLLMHFGEEHQPERVELFYRTYLTYLDEHLTGGGFGGGVLPGVGEMLAVLESGGVTLGLLTGNIARGAALKMRHYRLDHHFAFGAYGDDHHEREKLGPVALERAGRSAGVSFAGTRTVVLGDTPRDISCGRAIGAMAVCVATGSYDEETLRAAGAHLVFSSLADYNNCISEIFAHEFWEIG